MYGWWKSSDGKVHAFDLLANLGKSELTAVCGHTATRDQIIESCRGPWDRHCLEALNAGVPQKQLLASLDKSRAEWRAHVARRRKGVRNGSMDRLSTVQPTYRPGT